MKKQTSSANEAAAKLAELIQGEPCYTPANVPTGFMPKRDIPLGGGVGTKHLRDRLVRLYREGKIDRVWVNEGGHKAYWYKVK